MEHLVLPVFCCTLGFALIKWDFFMVFLELFSCVLYIYLIKQLFNGGVTRWLQNISR